VCVEWLKCALRKGGLESRITALLESYLLLWCFDVFSEFVCPCDTNIQKYVTATIFAQSSRTRKTIPVQYITLSDVIHILQRNSHFWL
jgi:hypothetical protein